MWTGEVVNFFTSIPSLTTTAMTKTTIATFTAVLSVVLSLFFSFFWAFVMRFGCSAVGDG